jgi:preprotein translocase subunit SecA
MRAIVDPINVLEPKYEALDDDGLKRAGGELRQRVDRGESLDDVLPEAFALVREASKRATGMRLFDVQLIGGLVLHQGKIAEMKTGEGKTVVATLPSFLNALTGRGVHVVTVNDYLARRDANWMGSIHRMLGLEVGCIVHGVSEAERLAAYRADITYGQNNEFGFDYLRDNMKPSLDLFVQRDHAFAIVDEVDSILIDEARTPLIISGPVDDDPEKFRRIDKLIPRLRAEEHYTVDEKARQVSLTDDGVATMEKLLGIDNLYAPEHMEDLHVVQNGLRAHTLYERDVQYVVQDGEIVIVDEFTGRLMSGRRWSDGIHQAVEAKERVTVQNESQTYASITFQNYFRMYDKLAGMTGTADTEAPEFAKIYDLDVIVVPTNREMVRADHEDVVYGSKAEKWDAVIDEIAEAQQRRQPVLVGTIAVETSEALSKKLKNRGVKHNVLNAKQHGSEAQVIAQAGVPGTVTISTNMAGRGTDIVLGGNPEMTLTSRGLDPEAPENAEQLEKMRVECVAAREEVLEAGGLYVIGTERHESRRIDNQLRGRSGRQGDAGTTRFFLSLEDDLLRIFGSERIKGLMKTLGMKEGEAIEAKMLTKQIERAQGKVESRNFDIRKNLLEYDDVMNKQRESIYAWRKQVLERDLFEEEYLSLANGLTDELIEMTIQERGPSDIEVLAQEVERQFGFTLDLDDETFSPPNGEVSPEKARDRLNELVRERLDSQAQMFLDMKQTHSEMDLPSFSDIGRGVLLQVMDQQWKDHLLSMDHLKEGIGLVGYGGTDPKREYQKRGFDMFMSMEQRIRARCVEQMFHVAFQMPSEERQQQLRIAEENRRRALDLQLREQHPTGAPDSDGPQQTVTREGPKVGRNQPCPCGSGKKFKRCHGAAG